MEIFSGLRNGLGKIVLYRKLRHHSRNKKVYNLNTARTVGILFDATNPNCFESVYKFYKDLSSGHLSVTVLGYLHGKTIPDKYLFKKDFYFFYKQEVTFLYKFKNPEVKKFLNRKFDILIDLNLDKSFLFDTLTALSLARFKVGRFQAEKNYFDFMINMEEEPTLEYFMQQVKHYLELINRPELTPKFQNI